MFFGCRADGALGAARIGDQRTFGHMARDLRQALDGEAHGESDVNQVRAGQRLGQLRIGFIDYAQLQGAFEHGGLVPADEADAFLRAQERPPRGQGKRAAY